MNGILLAGGLSVRMGKDKRDLPWNDQTLLTRALSNMQTFCQKVWVVVHDKEKFKSLNTSKGVAVTQDIFPQRSALCGIFTGLIHSETQWNFAQPCDMPFVSPDLMRRLAALASDDLDWILPSYRSRLQPLCALYSKECIPVMEDALRKGKCKIIDLRTKLRTRVVPYKEISHYDREGKSFMNVNTPKDYERAHAQRH